MLRSMLSLLCFMGNKEALARGVQLDRTEQRARQVVCKGPEYRLVLERIVRDQPSHAAAKDRFLGLLSGVIEP